VSEESQARQRLRYRFDNLLARGTWATLLLLGLATLLAVGVSALALALFDVALSGSQGASFLEDFWQSLLRVLDTGTMAGDVGWGRRVLALGITLFGVLVAGTLIGVIAAGVEDRIERMRRGRSAVFESGHVVVLGASDRLPLLIRQLVLARQGNRDSVIVVMADGDPAVLQEDVRREANELRGSRLVFRSGDPTHPPDLELVRIDKADMVIVLADEHAGDSRAIRTVVAVLAELGDSGSVPVVVELEEPASADSLARVYGNAVHPLVPSQAVARIAAFALREPGTGQVAMALLDDRGSDVHVTHVPSFEGRRFSDVLDAFPSARVIGIMRPGGDTELNPPPDTLFGASDRVVLISDSSDELPTFGTSDAPSLRSGGPPVPDLDLRQPDQHLLVWGWSGLGAYILGDWAGVAAPSSTLEVMLDRSLFDRGDVTLGGSGRSVETALAHDVTDLAARLDRAPRIDTILLCAPRPDQGDEAADSRTLLDLAAIRQMLGRRGEPDPRVIVELLDVENIPLANMPNPDDFVISEAIASQLIAQLAELPDRRRVFLALYAAEGASIHLVQAAELGLTGRQRAGDIYGAGQRAGVLPIGWRRPGASVDRLVINPQRSQSVDLVDGDQIVVIG
jgi:Trk K+ transport system NAD-binding subunit